MNIHRLNTFLILSETLSFSEAANQLFCTQPAVSLQIKTLESELGTKLFERIGKRIYLTQNAISFKQYAEQIIKIWNHAKDEMSANDQNAFGNLNFGASNFVGIYLLPHLLSQFHIQYPNIKINMQVRSSKTLLNKLENNELDFLIMSSKISFDPKAYFSKIFYKDELVLVAPPTHPLANEVNVSINSLISHTMLWKPQHSATRIFLDNTFKQNNITIKNNIEISSIEAIKQSVLHNLGIAFISKCTVHNEIKSGQLVEIQIPNLKIIRGIQYVVKKDKVLSYTTKKFIDLLNQPSNFK